MSQAQANGMSLEAFVEQVLRERSSAGLREGMRSQTSHELSFEERLSEFQTWVNSHADNTVVLAHESMERESIYGDHGR